MASRRVEELARTMSFKCTLSQINQIKSWDLLLLHYIFLSQFDTAP